MQYENEEQGGESGYIESYQCRLAGCRSEKERCISGYVFLKEYWFVHILFLHKVSYFTDKMLWLSINRPK